MIRRICGAHAACNRSRSSFLKALLISLFALSFLAGNAASAQTTTISGSVYAPNGVDPLSNVLVYITTGSVAPIVAGANCPGSNCMTAATAVPANAIVSTYTGANGSFALAGVSESTTYTLVIQAGKWRRQFSEVVGSSPVTGLSLDMPSTHAQGDIPLIAIATGNADTVECVLRDVGVNDSEFTDDNGSGGGRIHLYKGDQTAGADINASTPSETALMSTPATLNGYDIVMFPCQGTANAESPAYIDNLLAYTSAGGRAFVTHDSRVWINTNTTIASGQYAGATFSGAATWNTLSNPPDGAATINTSFTDGARLAQWMQDLGQSYQGTLGQVAISTLRRDAASVLAPTQTWLTLNSDSAIMQLTFNTPVGAAAADQYGRVLFNEYHVENATGVTGKAFPTECGASPHNPLTPGQMSAQEKMLEYSLFDLTNFVTPIVNPTLTIAISTDPANSVFDEGDTADTITVDVTNTSTTIPIDNSAVLTMTLPTGLTATAITDASGGWLCNVNNLTCTRTTAIAPNASDSVVITVSVAGNATGGAASASTSVSAQVASPTFSSNVTTPISITLDRHAAVTWAAPVAVADGTALSSTQLNAVGNTAGTYVYNPGAGTVLSPGSHTLSVTFTPSDQVTYPGTATATVTLVVNAAVTATVSSPAATNFGSVPVGTASSIQTVTFTFLTAGVIGSPAVITEGVTALEFTDAGTGSCDTNGSSYAYAASGSCSVNLIFTPSYPGERFGSALLKDGSGNVLATAYLYGIGTGPQTNFLPATELSITTSANGIAHPRGLALDGAGNLYTADDTNNAIYKTTPQGVTTKVLDLTSAGAQPATPQSLAIDGAGNLYIADSTNGQVLEATPSSGGYVLNPSPIATGLSGSRGVAVDPFGNVYIADSGNNRILLETLQSNGGYVQTVIISPSTSILGTALNAPSGVAVDGSGDVFLADSGNNRVLEESYSAGAYTPALIASALDWPAQLILDGNGNLYFATNGQSNIANSHIYMETPSGGSYTQSVVLTSLTASSVWGVAVAGSGNVYLSDDTDDKVIEEDFADAPSLSFASTHVGSTSTDSPKAVTVENVGNAALDITGSGLTAPADFSQVAGSGSPVDCADNGTVAAGSACTISLRFMPTVTGSPLSELFGIADNSLNATPASQHIALSGTATPAPLVLSPASSTLAAGSAGDPYASVTFAATGGTGPYTYAFTGALPTGLSLSSSGVLSGTPTISGGPYSFTVTATDADSVTGSRTYSITVNAAIPTQLSASAVPSTLVSGANLGTLLATIEDADGNAVTNSSAVVTETITGPNGYSHTVSVATVNGVATFNLSSLSLTTAGAYTVTTSSLGLPSVSSPVTVTAGATAQMAVSGIPVTIVAGGNLGSATVKIEDANGNVETNSSAVVTETITGPNGYSQAVTVTAVNGIATFNLAPFALTVDGSYTVTTASTDLTNVISPVSVTAGAAAQMASSGVPTSIVAGANLGIVTVRIEDAYGNVETSSAAVVTETILGPNEYAQTITATALNGIATFNFGSLPLNFTGAYTVTAASAGLPSVISSVMVVAGTPAQLAVSGIPTAVSAGSSLGTGTVRIEDADGNVEIASSALVTEIIAGPNGYSQQVTVAAVNGIATFNLTSLTLTTPGAYTVTSSSAGVASVVSPVTVTAGAPALLLVSGIPPTLVAGGNLGIVTARIEDANGNIVTSSSAVVTETITGPNGYSQALSATAVNGVATFDLSSLILSGSGAYTVTTASVGLPSITSPVAVSQAFTLTFTQGTSATPTQTVSPGAVASFPFTLAPANSSFTGVITLSASGLPVGATYSFSPPTVTPGSGSAASMLTVVTAKTNAALHAPDFGKGFGAIALGLLLAPLAGSRRLRKAWRQTPWMVVVFALLSIGAVCGLTGCGAGGLYGNTQKTYIITVTGTSGSLSESTTVTLVLQ